MASIGCPGGTGFPLCLRALGGCSELSWLVHPWFQVAEWNKQVHCSYGCPHLLGPHSLLTRPWRWGSILAVSCPCHCHQCFLRDLPPSLASPPPCALHSATHPASKKSHLAAQLTSPEPIFSVHVVQCICEKCVHPYKCHHQLRI